MNFMLGFFFFNVLSVPTPILRFSDLLELTGLIFTGQHIVGHMPTIYYSDRIQSKISKGKRHMR